MNDFIIGAWVAFFLLARKVAFSIVVHQTSHFVENSFVRLFGSTDRKAIIHTHYLERAKSNGHVAKHVTECHEDSCSLLTASAA